MQKLYFFYKIFRSYLRIIFFKFLYGKRFQINLKNKIYLGKGTNIEIGKNGKFILKGNFNCRNYNNFKITEGILEIGDGVFFNNGNSINCRDNIVVGDNTIFGEGIKIYDHDHNIVKNSLIKNSGYKKMRVSIGDNCWICSNVIILRGSIIEEDSVINSGSIVKRKIQKYHWEKKNGESIISRGF